MLNQYHCLIYTGDKGEKGEPGAPGLPGSPGECGGDCGVSLSHLPQTLLLLFHSMKNSCANIINILCRVRQAVLVVQANQVLRYIICNT